MVKVLFVCMGNICRSPTAEGVFRALVTGQGIDGIEIDSAGTLGFHAGEPPDRRATEAAAKRGIDLSGQRARRVKPADFEIFDYILAMDGSNRSDLIALSPTGAADKVRLFLDFAPELGVADVPDPYYGRTDGFDYVLDLVEEASRGLLDDIKANYP